MYFEVKCLLQKVKQTINRYGLLEPGERILVGFSGGVDSLTLLHILRSLTEWRLELWAVYINHSLRPAENLRETALLHQVGVEWGVRTREVVIDIPARLREKPQSLQLLAREERYRIFNELRREIGAAKVALAHHRDDQVETVLYRVIRGTGLEGLAGIPVTRDGIYIRPLLEVSRPEIVAYAKEHRLAWEEDSSNQKTVYRRNRLRLQLLPELEREYNPRVRQAITRLANLAVEHRSYIEQEIANRLPLLIVREQGRVGVRLALFRETHAYLQYYLLKKLAEITQPACRLESVTLLRLRDRLNRGDLKSVDLAKGLSAYYENGVVFLGVRPAAPPFFPRQQPIVTVTAPGRTCLPEFVKELVIKPGKIPDAWNKMQRTEIFVDPAKLQLPLAVRNWKPGDRFQPLGAVGTQKLQDFFINQKIPLTERHRIPLLVTADDRIVWVMGFRAADHFKITDPNSPAWHLMVQTLSKG